MSSYMRKLMLRKVNLAKESRDNQLVTELAFMFRLVIFSMLLSTPFSCLPLN